MNEGFCHEWNVILSQSQTRSFCDVANANSQGSILTCRLNGPRPISIAFARFIPTFSLVQFADKTSRLTNDFGRSRDENPGGGALVGVAGTRHTPFAAIARVDRNAHRALGRKAAVIPDHILFCNYCTRGASNLVPIS